MSVVALHLLMIPVMTLCTSGRSRGQRHVRDAPQFFPLLVVHSLATAWLMPWMDARDLWVLPGGDVLRWTGLAALALGVALRMASMIVLGRRFSGLVSLQAGHRLQVSGLYARIRHPSYLGILLIDIGFVGVFRSAVALALLPAVMVMLKLRMDREERFMERAFEAEYRDYRARTWRLVPGVY
jgi:protein-S-isoprenylcysteine O-methyltransferase Ste14